MKILKWLLTYISMFLIIKNIQIILQILFEHKEIVAIIISYLFAIVAIILNCISKSQIDTNKVNSQRRNKI